jgi:hypothetical protein
MGARPQQAGETENGTERFATSAENRNGLTAFLVSFLDFWKKWIGVTTG